MPQLSEKEKLIRDINGLRVSLSQDFIDMTDPSLTRNEKEGIKRHMDWIVAEINELQLRLDAIGTVD
jgi:hypothetical protein